MKRGIRHHLICMIALVLFLAAVEGASAGERQGIRENGVYAALDASGQAQGKVDIYGETDKEKIKIMVEKEGTQTWYDVDLKRGNFRQEVWLNQGKGIYTVAVMVHEYDRKYSYGPEFTVENTEDVDKFSVPGKNIESDDEKIIVLAREITKGKETDKDKAQAIYDWVVENIDYDYEKYMKHQQGDYSSKYGALNTLKTKKGVCYDYATLAAALGRAAGLRVKVVEGEGENGGTKGSHAWNEVFIREEDRWVPFDTTFGALDNGSYFDNADFAENHVKVWEY